MLHRNICSDKLSFLHIASLSRLSTADRGRVQTSEFFKLLLLPLINGTRRKDSLFSLAQAGENAFCDQYLSQIPASTPSTVGVLLCQSFSGLDQHIVIVSCVIDVADLLVLGGLVDWTEVACAQEACIKVLGGWREISWVLQITKIAVSF